MDFTEKLEVALKTAWGEIENIAPEMVILAKSFAGYVLSLKFLSDPVTVKISTLTGFFDSFANLFQGLSVRLPAIIAASIIISEVELPKELGQRVMKLDDAARFPLEVILQYGIRGAVTGGVPTSLNLAKQMDSFANRIKALVERNVPRFLKSLLGSMAFRVIKLCFFVIQIAMIWSLVLCMWGYSKELGKSPPLLGRALTDKNPREKTKKIRIRRRIGGVKP